jgi:thiamine biosynthesis lipoprotein ApbE
MGFGHYTAYAKSPIQEKWYEYDDSRVTLINQNQVKQTVVTSAAYNLFYRRRDWHQKNKGQADFDMLALKPDMQYITNSKS